MPPPTPAEDAATEVFVTHRELLFSVVYGMLGLVADTEDVLQETWLSWTARAGAADGEPIDSPRAYLVRIAVNKALGRQDAVRRRRETYVGPWLPEPLLTPEVVVADASGEVEQGEAVSMALLVVLETLTPVERAVFVLHEVFGHPHTETAAILGRSPAAVRQLAHRAREHVQARRPRFQTDPLIRRRVTERFAAAVSGGDLAELLEVLAPEVVMWADGGGKATAAGPRPVHGRDRVAGVLLRGGSRNAAQLRVVFGRVNGDPSALLYAGEGPFAVLVLELAPDSDLVTGIYFVTNPDKLAHLS
jgi:RNA polymerase sigma factor (sigma-70 family)